jgi:uncharacterized protein
MACRYCDFAAPKTASPAMDLGVARAAVDAYLTLLEDSGRDRGQIHFFGGEPFRAPDVVEFVVEHAGLQSAERGIAMHFEASTNGLFSSARAEWVADRFGTIVLSLDGPPDIQNRQRPALHGRPSFGVVERTARILSEGTVELILRSCVTSATVDRLPELARWIVREFRPSTVCFESLTSSPLSSAAGVLPPDPFRFARQFTAAARILAEHGIETVQSTTDVSECRVAACPVGQDALIVSPDGAIDACYLLEDEWRSHGLDLRLGSVDVAGRCFLIDEGALRRVRHIPTREKSLCANCFCRYHCAGGCHVHHRTDREPGDYDELCVITRLITAAKLLGRLGQPDVADELLADPTATAVLAGQVDDRLLPESVS